MRRLLVDGYRAAFVATKAEHVERVFNLFGCAEDQLFAGRIDVTRHALKTMHTTVRNSVSR
ncbi:hypothetical protein [Bradyrhizobium yuanmingense]|uniref:hypothetical protein n=1 Tax=Bradyrhizobium yuanmingense TaxID=108015 RepID=UPI001FD9C6E7|nr:hypothetical protein [Bradyrhizobium yuanmingense]